MQCGTSLKWSLEMESPKLSKVWRLQHFAKKTTSNPLRIENNGGGIARKSLTNILQSLFFTTKKRNRRNWLGLSIHNEISWKARMGNWKVGKALLLPRLGEVGNGSKYYCSLYLIPNHAMKETRRRVLILLLFIGGLKQTIAQMLDTSFAI